ncbi:MAG TPA: glycosyltransferase 87 family protein [Thermomicrobiales bacterium]|nr:glycosyltransferase 87 family protein [Thermomicrobiales bacterium]
MATLTRAASVGRSLPLVRAARLLVLAIVIGWSISNLAFHVAAWNLSDMDAYWNAAMRLRGGQPLFPAVADPSAADVYRYSPWFAAAWVPLTFAPKVIVGVVWSIVLLAATAVALWPLRRGGLTSLAAAFLLGSFLVWAASVGNVQPLLIAALVHGMERRSGPLWIGLTASLKAVPFLYVLIYIGRREWVRAALAVAVTAVLVAPFLLVSLANYPAGSGDAPSPLLSVSPILLVATVAGLAGVAVWLAGRRSRFDRLAAATAALTALPRITLLDLPQLLVGVRESSRKP